MNMMGTLIHGIAASEAIDTANEILKIDGLDISTLAVDGVLNYEHQSNLPSHVVGKILYAKKIFSEDDCSNPLERKFWQKVKLPFLYVVGELFDAVGHQQASEVAAMLRYQDEKLKLNPDQKHLVNFSIEGAKLETKKGIIKEAIARKVTITTHPANKSCIAELLPESDYQMYIARLVKNEWQGEALLKAYSAGAIDVAPSERTGGSAIVKKVRLIKKKSGLVNFLKNRLSISKAEAIYLAKYFLKKHLDNLQNTQNDLGQAYKTDLNKKHNVKNGQQQVLAKAIKDLETKIQNLRDFIEKHEPIKKIFRQDIEKTDMLKKHYKEYVKELIKVLYKHNKPIYTSLILMPQPDFPLNDESITLQERAIYFQQVAEEIGLDPAYPIVYDHKTYGANLLKNESGEYDLKLSWRRPGQIKYQSQYKEVLAKGLSRAMVLGAFIKAWDKAKK